MKGQLKNGFENMPVSKAILKMAGPTIVSMLVTVVYNMTDTFFVGRTGDPTQVAAVALTTPVFLVLMAFGNLFGVGGGSLSSRSLGEKNLVKIKNISAFCFYAICAFGLAAFLLLELFPGQISLFLGAKDANVVLAVQYIRYLAIGAPFIILSSAFSHLVRAEGASAKAMVGNLIGTGVNIVLDPILILALHMGVAGAAVATVIGNVCATGYYLFYLRNPATNMSLSFSYFTVKDRIPQEIFSIGIPSFFTSIMASVTQIVLNNYLKLYGDSAIAAMGVAHKMNLLMTLLLTGLCTGVQPLIAYNYGAKDYSRIREIMKCTVLYAVALGTAMSVTMGIGKEYLIRFFIDDAQVIAYGKQMLTALLLPGPVLGILFACMNCMQGMGKAAAALFTSISRQGLLFLPAIVILHSCFGFGGLIYAQTTADFISVAIAAVMCWRILQKYGQEFQMSKGRGVYEQNL